ncbi:MAG: hypothetical protein LQ343_003576 [Gyalolechia ehrenbergii]|nr:MAG: hypothetical protein LQ343_003576 [Gyalolechia ehrenbergii]
MAEVLFDDDDDDDLWIEDPYADADDLAEHTMHSPVLINYDPAIEINDEWSDWDDYSTDFYDSDEPRKKRRKVNKASLGEEGTLRKPKRGIESIGNLPDLSLGDPYSSDEDVKLHVRPTVIWKRRDYSPKLPILQHGQGQKVSILKDWPVRFKLPSPSRETAAPRTPGHQRAVAVVIQQTPAPNDVGNVHDASSSISASTQKHPQGVALPSDSNSSDPVSKFAEKPMDHRFKRTKREDSRSLLPPPEPVLANGSASAKRKRKRFANDDDDDLSVPRKMRFPRGSHDPPEADKPGLDEANADIGDGIPASPGAVASPTTGRNGSLDQHATTARHRRKRKQPPAEDDPACKPDPKKLKSKPPEKQSAKENSRPKAAPVERRRTRRK